MDDTTLLGLLDAKARGEFAISIKWPKSLTMYLDAIRDGDRIAYQVIGDKGGETVDVPDQGIISVEEARETLPNLYIFLAKKMVDGVRRSLDMYEFATVLATALGDEERIKDLNARIPPLPEKVEEAIPDRDEAEKVNAAWNAYIKEITA